MNSDNLKLRQTEHPPLENLDELLTADQFDQNNINIFEDFLALSNSSSIEEFDEVTVFDSEFRNCCTYLGRTYKYINIDAGIVSTPTEDDEVWIEIFPTDFAHKKNRDSKLD